MDKAASILQMRPANQHSSYEGAHLCQMLSNSPNECERPGKIILDERSEFDGNSVQARIQAC